MASTDVDGKHNDDKDETYGEIRKKIKNFKGDDAKSLCDGLLQEIRDRLKSIEDNDAIVICDELLRVLDSLENKTKSTTNEEQEKQELQKQIAQQQTEIETLTTENAKLQKIATETNSLREQLALLRTEIDTLRKQNQNKRQATDMCYSSLKSLWTTMATLDQETAAMNPYYEYVKLTYGNNLQPVTTKSHHLSEPLWRHLRNEFTTLQTYIHEHSTEAGSHSTCYDDLTSVIEATMKTLIRDTGATR